MTCSSLPWSLAVGHTIEDLHLCDWDVSVTAVRHGGKRDGTPGLKRAYRLAMYWYWQALPITSSMQRDFYITVFYPVFVWKPP
ncbi:MAG: hypothetical protein LC541_11720 [Candidatus Thiodiazotropha sp.]|nr:hypothetical protein [Candidatus Thiodiazotropha sp.]MCM8883942.1 hypothetical protein [Candidatus Thiodiazotropha sp.]MCM8921072.1 hypothetical protein [Candidatus Thiodiazotropha sp.]